MCIYIYMCVCVCCASKKQQQHKKQTNKKSMKQCVLFVCLLFSFMFLQFYMTGTIRVLCIRDAPPVYCHLGRYSYPSVYHIHVWYSERCLTAELAGSCISWRVHYWYVAKSWVEIALTISSRRRPDFFFFCGTYVVGLVAWSLGEVVETECWLSSQFIRHNQAISRCLLSSRPADNGGRSCCHRG